MARAPPTDVSEESLLVGVDICFLKPKEWTLIFRQKHSCSFHFQRVLTIQTPKFTNLTKVSASSKALTSIPSCQGYLTLEQHINLRCSLHRDRRACQPNAKSASQGCKIILLLHHSMGTAQVTRCHDMIV